MGTSSKVDLRVPGGLLLVPALVVLGHGLLYAVMTLMLALGALGMGGLIALGALAEGSAEGLLALLFVGGMGGATVLVMLGFTLVLLVFGAVILGSSIHALVGRGSPVILSVIALLSFLMCGFFTVMSLVAFNPLVVLWALGCVLSLVGGVLALVAAASR
jgi:hypothetical protein